LTFQWINNYTNHGLTLLVAALAASCVACSTPECYPEAADVATDVVLSNSQDTTTSLRVNANFDSKVTAWHFTADQPVAVVWVPPAQAAALPAPSSSSPAVASGQGTPSENVIPGQERHGQVPAQSAPAPNSVAPQASLGFPAGSSSPATALPGELTLECSAYATGSCQSVQIDVEVPARSNLRLTTRVHNQHPGCGFQMGYTLSVQAAPALSTRP
jgi:hypothetical protein